MQVPATDNFVFLIILAMVGTFLLICFFVLFSVRNQNKLLRQKQQFAQAQLIHQKELLHAIIESQETERTRIGQDLHDDVGTTLSGLRLLIDMFKPQNDTDPDYLSFIGSSKIIIDKIVKDVRNISHNLSPTTLRYYGLAAAISEHCTIINQSGKLEITLTDNANEVLDKLPLPAATALYRVTEELINNTIKHSGASKAGITFSANGETLVIKYADNGKGLQVEASQAQKGMGLQNIESRLLNINATFTLEPYQGKGFNITIDYPIAHTALA